MSSPKADKRKKGPENSRCWPEAKRKPQTKETKKKQGQGCLSKRGEKEKCYLLWSEQYVWLWQRFWIVVADVVVVVVVVVVIGDSTCLRRGQTMSSLPWTAWPHVDLYELSFSAFSLHSLGFGEEGRGGSQGRERLYGLGLDLQPPEKVSLCSANSTSETPLVYGRTYELCQEEQSRFTSSRSSAWLIGRESQCFD